MWVDWLKKKIIILLGLKLMDIFNISVSRTDGLKVKLILKRKSYLSNLKTLIDIDGKFNVLKDEETLTEQNRRLSTDVI